MTRKRGNNEGTFRKRSDGRWEARITLEDGSRKSMYGVTRQEAATRMSELLRDLAKGLPVVGERQTVREYMVSWLATVKPTIESTTWQRYGEYVRLHTLPRLGGVALSRLTPQQVQALYAAKLEEGLSPTTVSHLHALLHSALNDALRLGLVQRNVCDLVNPPRKRKVEMMTLTPEQARLMLETAAADRLEALYVVALTTGMREGELFALKWRDVNVDTAALQVRATLKNSEAGLITTYPKTSRSRRQIALTQVAVEAIRRQGARQNEERLAIGPAWRDKDFVFTDVIGGPLRRSNVLYRNFKPLLKRAGLPQIRFHDLRHTAATLMLLQGIHPKVVSEILGHASVSITLDLYSHVLPTMQKDATAALDRLLGSEAK